MSAEKTKNAKQPAEPKKRAPAKNSKAVKETSAAEPAKKPAAKAEQKSKSPAKAESKTAAKASKPSAKASEKAVKPKAAAKPETKPAAKAPAKKPAAKKSVKKSDRTGGEQSSKTPQVMRLVEQRNDMVNPTILAGKSSIPRRLRGLEPLTKIMKRDAETVFGTDEEAETFNLTALVIDDHAAQILRRFNACDCEVCIERLSQLTADSVPARFVKLKKRSVERKAAEVEELKAPLRRAVTSRMIRLVMQNKKRSFHDI